MNKIIIGGIVTLIILLSSAITYQIQSLGEKTGCRRGWEYIASGEFEGHYGCTTQSGIRYQVCFNVYNSTNTENYWCEKGKIVKIEEKEVILEDKVEGNEILCHPPPRYDCTKK